MAADVYSVSMSNQTVVANGTLVIVHTATALSSRGSIVEILRAWASQSSTATAQNLGIQLATKASAFGTYTGATPASHVMGGSISGIVAGTAGAAGTSGTNASAEGAGTVTAIINDSFDNLTGWLWVPTPEERIIVPQDTAIILKLVGTPTTLTGWAAGITIHEIS